MNHFSKWARAALLARATSLSLAGCGGGDDSPSPISDDRGSPPPPPYTGFAAAGFWGGPQVRVGWVEPPGSAGGKGEDAAKYSGMQANFWDTAAADGSHIGLVILPTGKTWWISIDGGVIMGAGHGQTQVTGSSVTTKWASLDPTGAGGTSDIGSVVPRSQLDLAPDDKTPSLWTTKWRTTYDARYEQAATQAQLAGVYTGASSNGSGTTYTLQPKPIYTGLGGAGGIPAPYTPTDLNPLSKGNYTVTISSTGEVTLPPDPLGCSGSGAAMPRTDSNVYNLSIRFSGTKCVLGNGVAVQGIAVVENGHLLMLAAPPEGAYPAGVFAFMSN